MTSLQQMLALPTCMGADAEVRAIRELMAMSVPDLVTDAETFLKVVSNLEESHGCGVYGITTDNEATFQAFADWLKSVADNPGLADAAYAADIFRVTLADVQRAHHVD